MTSIDSLIQGIDGRLAELTIEISSLEAARTALVSKTNGRAKTEPKARKVKAKPAEAEKPAAKATPATPARKPRRRRKRCARREAPRPPRRAWRAVHSRSGQARPGDADQVLPLLRELETAERIRRTGQRRSTRWYIITDDDRVAGTVAELELASSGSATNT
jgi:hypothetical protein